RIFLIIIYCPGLSLLLMFLIIISEFLLISSSCTSDFLRSSSPTILFEREVQLIITLRNAPSAAVLRREAATPASDKEFWFPFSATASIYGNAILQVLITREGTTAASNVASSIFLLLVFFSSSVSLGNLKASITLLNAWLSSSANFKKSLF